MTAFDLPTDPSDEELSLDWNLSASDFVEVRRCRGDAHRHRFAIQLCALRSSGRFVDEFTTVPVRIANHVGCQLGLPPLLFIPALDRPATATEHTQRIREYLGYRPFDDSAQKRLRGLLRESAGDGIMAVPLLAMAVDALRSWQMELPARSTMERLVASCTAQGEAATWQRIQERLTPDFCAAVDAMLAVPEGNRRSTLSEFKQYPPSARPVAIQSHLDRFSALRTIGAGRLDLAGFGSKLVEHLAGLGRRYDVDDLKRFAPAKRYALAACFLAEAEKTTLDHLVEMHREFLTGMSRRARRAVEEHHREIRRREQGSRHCARRHGHRPEPRQLAGDAA